MVPEIGIAVTFCIIGVIFLVYGLLRNREYRGILRLISSIQRSPISEVLFVMSSVLLYLGIIGLISYYSQGLTAFLVFSAIFGIIGVLLGLGGMATLGELDPTQNQTHSTLFSTIFSFWIGGWIVILASLLTSTIETKDFVSLLLFTTPFILLTGVNYAVEAIKAESRRRDETES